MKRSFCSNTTRPSNAEGGRADEFGYFERAFENHGRFAVTAQGRALIFKRRSHKRWTWQFEAAILQNSCGRVSATRPANRTVKRSLWEID